MVQRVCGTGIEVLAQAADAVSLGRAELALCVGAESMSRNPVAAYTHRGGFRMGQVEFKDFLWEALLDPAPTSPWATPPRTWRGTTRSPAPRSTPSRRAFARAVKAQDDGFLAGEIVAGDERDVRARRLNARGIKLQGRVERPTPISGPRRSSSWRKSARPSAACRPAAIPRPSSTAPRPCWSAPPTTRASSARRRWRASSPAPRSACRRRSWASARCRRSAPCWSAPGSTLDDIDRFEINEAFGAQVMACARELGLDEDKLNVNGGAIAIGHPLGATGVRLTLTLARELKRSGSRYGIASACIGGGQGIALLIENTDVGSRNRQIRVPATGTRQCGSLRGNDGCGASNRIDADGSQRTSRHRHRRRFGPGRGHRAHAGRGRRQGRAPRRQRQGRRRGGDRHRRHRHPLRRRRSGQRRSRHQEGRRRPRAGAHPGQLRRHRRRPSASSAATGRCRSPTSSASSAST